MRRLVIAIAVSLGALAASAPASALVDDSSPSMGWRPNGGITYAMARVGNMVVLGGSFTQMVSPTGSPVTRNRLAAIDATTGELLPWNPAPNGAVWSVTGSPDGSTVYIGGVFSSVGGSTRSNLAAISMSGRATPFIANTDGVVRSLTVHSGGLLLTGVFGRVNGLARGNGAEVDPTTGALRAWNPRSNWGIYDAEPTPDGSSVFIGGTFTRVGGQPREYLAKVSRSTGDVDSWVSGNTCQDATNPCHVYALRDTGPSLIVGQGGPGGRVVSLDSVTGTQRWWTGSDGDFQDIYVDGQKVYGAGHFDTAVAGQTRAGLVALDLSTGAVLPELTSPVLGGSGVWKVARDGDLLRLAGQFTTIGGQSIGKYATYPVLPDPVDSTPPSRPTSVRALAVLDTMVSLMWSRASDNVATTKYHIFRNGELIGESPTPFFRDQTAAPETRYSYTISASDPSGNQSVASSTLTVTTSAAFKTLLPRGAQWYVNSTGELPAANWMAPGYQPSDWGTGVGEFGFGDGDEATYISPKGVAHYFRTDFDVPSAAAIESATLRLLVDDGAVVYLNGTEFARYNMPSGPVANTTTAATSLGVPTEAQFQTISVPVAALQNGRNVLAVEVHNSSTASSDVSMDAVLTYAPKAVVTPPAQVTGLAGTATGDTVSLTWDAVAGASTYTVLRDGVAIGTTTVPSFTDPGRDAATRYVYTVAATNEAGTGPTSEDLGITTPEPPPPPPATPIGLRVTGTNPTSIALAWDSVPGADGYIVERDAVATATVSGASWEATGLTSGTSYVFTVRAINAGGTSPASLPVTATTDGAPPPTQYKVSGDIWRYNDSGADLGTAWNAPGFDDSAWKSGRTQLGYGDGDEATVLNSGPTNQRIITHYARSTFDAGPSVDDVQSLTLRVLADDGACVYLNGVEIARLNLPTGPLTSSTRASQAVAGSAESRWTDLVVPKSALQAGTNTLAVEVHNDSRSSSDISLDVELRPTR